VEKDREAKIAVLKHYAAYPDKYGTVMRKRYTVKSIERQGGGHFRRSTVQGKNRHEVFASNPVRIRAFRLMSTMDFHRQRYIA